MKRQAKPTKDLLIRRVPLALHLSLEQAAKAHHRSKTQEAIVVIEHGLKMELKPLQKPKAYDWGFYLDMDELIRAKKKGRA